jgi:MTH538 TIR-like domain (DUF1863)
MSVHQIHVFISHSWKYSDHYQTLSEWIFEQKWRSGSASLDFRDFSVPKDNPIHDAPNDGALKNAIYNQIARAHVVVIPTGMYAAYSKWIGKEIDGANYYRKPILAVNPWGQERKSQDVVQNAKKVVGWNRVPLVGAIWEIYRG